MHYLHNLTNSETLLIDRRRRGENQTQAAARFYVSQTLYSLWERGKHKHIPRVRKLNGELTACEVCFLKRRREKLTQRELAFRMDYSEEWVKRMERGEVDGTALFKYWGIDG